MPGFNKRVLKVGGGGADGRAGGHRLPEHQRVKTELLSNESPEITKASAESMNQIGQAVGREVKMQSRLSGEGKVEQGTSMHGVSSGENGTKEPRSYKAES